MSVFKEEEWKEEEEKKKDNCSLYKLPPESQLKEFEKVTWVRYKRESRETREDSSSLFQRMCSKRQRPATIH